MAAAKLTLKQERFVTEYLRDGNATAAAERAGYKQTRQSLGAQAYENLKKPQIQEAIKQALIHAEITPEWIMLEFKKIATNSTPLSLGYRLKALENLAKIIELTGFKQSQQQGTTINGDITISFGKPQTQPYYIDSSNEHS